MRVSPSNAMPAAALEGDALPLVSVVLLAKNERTALAATLPLLLAQVGVGEIEALVIDSGSSDGTVELVRELAAQNPRIRLLEIAPHAFHHARTRNLGAQLARAELLVFLGGDAVPLNRDWLRSLVAPVRAGSAAASYGRQIPRADADIVNRCRMAYNYPPESSTKSQSSPISRKALYFFSSVNCCLSRSRMPSPLFDERFPVNEDVTLSRALLGAGESIAYCADAVVTHSHNYTPSEAFRRYFDNAVVNRRLGIFTRGESGVRGEGLKYLRVSLGELRRARRAADYTRFALFFLLSALGVQLGIHSDRLPRRLGRAISKYGTIE